MFDWDAPLDCEDAVEAARSAPTEQPEHPSAQEGAAEISMWRCVAQPCMVVRRRMAMDSSPVRGLRYGEDVEVRGEPMNGWVKLAGGGFGLIRHARLGHLLERCAAEPPSGSAVFTEAHTKPEATVRDGATTAAQERAERCSMDSGPFREESARRVLAAAGCPHEVLELSPGAGSAEVRRSYHRLALLHHPDKGGDPKVFGAIGDAYELLSRARDESGGWRDLDGQSVGPWPGHAEMVKGVNVLQFDCFTRPPWESRRLYSGAFQEGVVRCWELSRGEPGKVQPPPRLLGEIHSGGFLNDIALLSPFGLVTAQSAGMKPLPGESLRTWNLGITPFRQVRQRPALADTGGVAACQERVPDVEGESREAMLARVNDALTAPEAGGYEPHAEAGEDLLRSTMVYQHYRGVRAVSLWPQPGGGGAGGAVPRFLGTISKDSLALWSVGAQGLGLEVPCLWSRADPQGGSDPSVLRHESGTRLWSSGNDSRVRCWDVHATGGAVVSAETGAAGWVTGMQLWPTSGVLVCSHSSGMLFFDMKAGKVIRNHFTRHAVGGVSVPHGESPAFFAGIGSDLMQYDTRLWRDGSDHKPKAVGSWRLRASITALHTTETSKGHVLVACGCENGELAAFDST